jgi:hypothetical protein
MLLQARLAAAAAAAAAAGCCSCLRLLVEEAGLADVDAVQELADVLVLHQALLVDQGSGPAGV